MSETIERNGQRQWITRYAPLIIWIGVILFLSSPQGSMAQTSRIIGPLLQFLFPSISPDQLLIVHGYVRKCAHFTEYGVLGFFAFRAFSVVGSSFFSANWFLAGICIVAAVAGIDEFNQSFEPSRTGSIWDVLIDISGGLFALSVCYLWSRRRK
jgi:VanZ family protein